MKLRSILPITALLAAAAVPSYGDSTNTILIDDSGTSLAFIVDGGSPIPCTSLPEDCFAIFVPVNPPATSITSPLPLNFNIYEDAGMTLLSDTLALSEDDSAGHPGLKVIFHSDLNGVPPTPLSNAISLVETGGIQTAANVTFSNGITEIVEFRSGEAPEPSSLALLGSGLIGLGVQARRRFVRET